MWSYSVCNFNLRYITLKDNEDTASACARLGFDPPFDQLCSNLGGTHGIGFNGWWVQTDQYCYDYTQLTPTGYQTPPFDTKFNSARALSITAGVFGAAAWYVNSIGFDLCVSVLFYRDEEKIFTLLFH
jgi:hypothetical protein